MEWIKTSIETTSAGVDAVTGILMNCGISGVEIIDSQERARFFADSTRTWDYADEALLTPDSDSAFVVFYVTKNSEGAKQIQDVAAALHVVANSDEYGSLTMRQESANDETWLHEWKKHFTPIRLGRIIIVPEWVEYKAVQPTDIIFTIDPGTAFGTGQHQTTQLCVNALQKHIQPNDRVLDIGCGSGILSIISLLLGASYVCAIDIDPAGAIAATKRNAELNPIDISRIKVLSGDVITDTTARSSVGAGYDIVVANIVADVIIPLAPLAKTFESKGKKFIASGIITSRLAEVMQAFAEAGYEIVEEEELDGWHCLVGVCNA